MTGRKGTLGPEDFIVAAMKHVDDHGLASLSMRVLGAELGVDATALYRHFPNKDSLVEAMVDRMLSEALEAHNPAGKSPREKVLDVVFAMRDAFARHPDIGLALISGEGKSINGYHLSVSITKYLAEMGLQGADLVRMYQTIEGYGIGCCVQDFTGSPHNYSIRRARYRMFEVPEFDDVARSEDSVRKITDEAFRGGFNAILDLCESLAHK
ncbi:MAG: TetR/AcrR family transcriptional regulator, partial [Actinomycetota bacterium]